MFGVVVSFRHDMLYWLFQEGTPKVLVGAWEPNLVNH